MTGLNLNRERLALLADISRGKVYRSAGAGVLMRRVRAGQNQRCDRKVHELQDAGLVDEQLRLTAAGTEAVR